MKVSILNIFSFVDAYLPKWIKNIVFYLDNCGINLDKKILSEINIYLLDGTNKSNVVVNTLTAELV